MASEKDITYPPAEAADNGSTSGNPQSQQHVDETLAQLEDPSSTQLSIRAILQGNATHPLTAFEKKAALINVELDSFGLGRYQICIWFLCGFGYFLDLAWSQGVGLAATAIYQEMNVPDGQTGKIYSLANAGLAVGAFSWGILVDIIGRKWAFNLTCLITSVFGLILVCSSSPYICRYMYIYTYIHIYSRLLCDPGSSQVQLQRHLRHILSRIHRSRWQHPHRCHHCPRIPASKPQKLGHATIALAAHWRRLRLCRGIWHRSETLLALQRQSSILRDHPGRRTSKFLDVLHRGQQYGMEISLHHSGCHDTCDFFLAILYLSLV